MPPFQPHPRQAAYGVTLTVIRPSTTYTTFVTLAPGAAPTDTGTVVPATTTASFSQTTGAATTTTISSASSPTTTFLGAAPTGGTPNGVVVGAILGSFVGFCVLLLWLWYCCYGGRNLCCVWYEDSDSSSYDSSYDSGSSVSRTRIRVRRRGGWMGSHGVRRPERARVRITRESVSTTTRSGRSVMLERRKSDRVPLFGFLYFGLNGPPRSDLVDETRRPRRRESVVGSVFG